MGGRERRKGIEAGPMTDGFASKTLHLLTFLTYNLRGIRMRDKSGRITKYGFGELGEYFPKERTENSISKSDTYSIGFRSFRILGGFGVPPLL